MNRPLWRAPSFAPERYKSVCAGLGFSLGFGWLWFPYLQNRWLPNFLWGNYGSGGGSSLFAALLLAGFFGFAFCMRQKNGQEKEAPEEFVRQSQTFRAGTVVHTATFLLVAAAFWRSWPDTAPGPWLTVFCMAAAALLQGTFWGGILLALPPRRAGEAFVTAACAGAAFAFLLPANAQNGGLPLLFAIGGAWLTSIILALLGRDSGGEKARPRGRPPKSGATEEAQRKGNSRTVLLLPLAALFALAAGEGALGIQAENIPPWTAALLTACGALAAFRLYGFVSGCGREDAVKGGGNPGLPPLMKLLCPALALFGLAFFLPLPPGPWLRGTARLVEGFVCAVALLQPARAQAASPPLSPARAAAGAFGIYRRAALVLGAVLIASVLGDLARSFFSAIPLPGFFTSIAPGAAPGPARLIGLLVLATALAPLLARKTRRDPGIEAEPGAAVKTENVFPGLTEREVEILQRLGAGMDDRGIAAGLGIKEVTVRSHVWRLCKKTGCVSRARLAALARASA
jgi:DNA-binding CsgD family transcriptional regulator